MKARSTDRSVVAKVDKLLVVNIEQVHGHKSIVLNYFGLPAAQNLQNVAYLGGLLPVAATGFSSSGVDISAGVIGFGITIFSIQLLNSLAGWEERGGTCSSFQVRHWACILYAVELRTKTDHDFILMYRQFLPQPFC